MLLFSALSHYPSEYPPLFIKMFAVFIKADLSPFAMNCYTLKRFDQFKLGVRLDESGYSEFRRNHKGAARIFCA
jgi:hypothetical protein